MHISTSLADAGIVADPLMCPAVSHAADAVRPVVLRLLDLLEPPTAFFVANARHATAVVSILHELRRTDIADGVVRKLSRYAEAVEPSVTCIDQDPYRIGNLAFDRLVQRFDDPYLEPAEQIAPTVLMERDSHNIRPVGREEIQFVSTRYVAGLDLGSTGVKVLVIDDARATRCS